MSTIIGPWSNEHIPIKKVTCYGGYLRMLRPKNSLNYDIYPLFIHFGPKKQFLKINILKKKLFLHKIDHTCSPHEYEHVSEKKSTRAIDF